MMMYKLLYKLPNVPDEFINAAWKYCGMNSDGEIVNNFETTLRGHGRELYKDGVLIGKSSANLRKKFSDSFEQWARENITPNFNDYGINFTESGMNYSGPHYDISRNYTLIYLLKNGGPDAVTRFYKLKDPSYKNKDNNNHYDDYNKLELIDEIKIPLYTWCIIDSKVIHSVDNISEGRIGIQISLMENLWNE
jgi:hypothetical protein